MKLLLVILISFISNQADIFIQDHYVMDHVNITYGSYLDDAYMFISDAKTEEIYNEIILDEGMNESFIYLAEVSQYHFIMVLEKYSSETKTNEYSLILYNIYGETIDRLDLQEAPSDFYNHHYVLIIKINDEYFYVSNDLELSKDLVTKTNVIGEYMVQYQGQAYINNESVEEILIDTPGIYKIMIKDNQYEYIEEIIVEANMDILGEIYKDGYIGGVQIISKGDIFVNEKEYISGDKLFMPGILEINVIGENYYVKKTNIKVYPIIIYYDGDDQFDLLDEMVFDYPIRLYSNADSIRINDELYEGHIITKSGDYIIDLIINGEIFETLNFSLMSRVEGVKHQETYEEVRFYAFGEVYLNDQLVQGMQLLKEPGTYNIKMKNQDESFEEIEFYILASNEEENKSLLPYGILIISVIGLAIILFKK